MRARTRETHAHARICYAARMAAKPRDFDSVLFHNTKVATGENVVRLVTPAL